MHITITEGPQSYKKIVQVLKQEGRIATSVLHLISEQSGQKTKNSKSNIHFSSNKCIIKKKGRCKGLIQESSPSTINHTLYKRPKNTELDPLIAEGSFDKSIFRLENAWQGYSYVTDEATNLLTHTKDQILRGHLTWSPIGYQERKHSLLKTSSSVSVVFV